MWMHLARDFGNKDAEELLNARKDGSIYAYRPPLWEQLEKDKAAAKKKAKAKAKAAKARAVGDMVEAKYKGDGKFYKARIEKVTAMAITVSFVDFGDEKAFVQAKDILNLGEKPPVKAKKGGKKDDAKSTKAKAGGKKK